MDHVAWDPTMSVGVEILDDDHKKLIGMLTVLLEDGVASKNRDDLVRLLNGLLEYTSVHFAREEDLMDRQGYPDLDAHKAAHRYFVDEVRKLSREYDESNTMMLRIDLILLLKEWLIEHIQSVDMRYKPFMAESAGTATAH
ncbi:bacteriohemerythrin [Azospirillum soli]|uniref:bacteriohemerythrin n=1 Tax=Azospirillum soli TaxID=1304799 RepID=UPI001AE1B827|nr:bacteriohemerythrin [Azospirillum soli]MBP2313814.1 hemerythrin [Azospirillum soli]